MADSGLAGRRRLSDRAEYERTGTAPTSFSGHWTKTDVKGLLHAMQGRVCAYCGIGIDGLDVEHFRPKGAMEDDEAHGGYWWLAYECSNYFLGCTVCNRYRKKATFPLFPGATRCTYATRDTIGAEKRVLLDPAEDPVEAWLTIDWDTATAKLVPNPVLNAAERSRVQEAIDLLGLNLDPEVRSQRSRAYGDAARAAVDRRWDDLRRSAMRHRPHSFAARAVLQEVAPERLPNAAEEMRDLIDSLWTDLRTLLSEIGDLRARGKPPGTFDERQLHALCWAIVILRSDPPADDTATVDNYLEDLLGREPADIGTEIVTLFRDLISTA
jgi:uncharacterized protein (TIGR02646 family)